MRTSELIAFIVWQVEEHRTALKWLFYERASQADEEHAKLRVGSVVRADFWRSQYRQSNPAYAHVTFWPRSECVCGGGPCGCHAGPGVTARP